MNYIKVKDVTDFVRNGACIKQDKQCLSGIPITRIETISNSQFNWDKVGYANITDDKYQDYYLKDKDVLLSHINSAKFLGRSVLFEQKDTNPIIHGMNLLCLRFKQTEYIPSFFVWYSKSQIANNYFAENTKKAVNQASITSSAIKEMPIPAISLEQQQKISNHLDSIQTAIDNKQQQLKELDELVKSRFIEMFGDIDDNSYNFPRKKIKDFAVCVAGATPSTKISEYWDNGTIPWMSSGEVHKGRIFETDSKISQLGYDSCSTKMIPPKTVLIALAGQGKTRGSVCITEISLCTNQSLCAVISKEEVFSDYLYSYLQLKYDELRKISNGDGGRGGLNLKHIGNFEVAIPSKELQSKWLSFVQQIDKSKFVVKQQIKDLQELMDSKMQEYFGE